jgi:hypothetical protein
MLWYHLLAMGHVGYPQPEDGWAEAAYAPGGYCARCGMGGVQANPFRFRSEPRAGRNQFRQLHWVFDEFFVRPEVETA